VVPVALAALPGTSMPQEGTVCQSSPTVLASGPIARSGDAISIELHQRDSMPAAFPPSGRPHQVPAVWTTAPTITTPARYNEVSSAAMQLLAEASTVFTRFKTSERL
jgi:hypothetical protein